MNHNHKYESYRNGWDLFKILLGINLLLLKFLLLFVQIAMLAK